MDITSIIQSMPPELYVTVASAIVLSSMSLLKRGIIRIEAWWKGVTKYEVKGLDSLAKTIMSITLTLVMGGLYYMVNTPDKEWLIGLGQASGPIFIIVQGLYAGFKQAKQKLEAEVEQTTAQQTLLNHTIEPSGVFPEALLPGSTVRPAPTDPF